MGLGSRLLYSVVMIFCNNFFRFALVALLLVLVGCNEKEKFMTPDHNYVLNATHEGLFLNGERVGGVIPDLGDLDDAFFNPFREKMEQYRPLTVMQTEPLVFHVHFDEGFNYGQFYNLISVLSYANEIQVAVDDYYDDPLTMPIDGKLDTCNMQHVKLMQSMRKKGSMGLIMKKEPILDEEGLKKREQNCAENFMKLSVTINKGSGQNYDYGISLNELGIVDGKKFYLYESWGSLLEALKEIQSRKSLADKQDKGRVTVAFSNDIPLSMLYVTYRDLRKLGYTIAGLAAFYR